MAGAYCKFCDRRCFVLRVIPGGPQKGWQGHLATCTRGKEHDRTQTGGFDADTALNPVTQAKACDLVARIVDTERQINVAVEVGALEDELFNRSVLDNLQREFEDQRDLEVVASGDQDSTMRGHDR